MFLLVYNSHANVRISDNYSVIIVTAFKTWEMKVIVPQTSCPAVTAKLVNECGSIQSCRIRVEMSLLSDLFSPDRVIL